MGVFSKSQGPANDVKRNAFDGSFENHFTTNFGKLVPVFCKEVMSGDTFEIDSAFGFNALPTIFPLQSKINATLHYFYVRGKNLWKDYYDWYFGTRDGLTPPYINPDKFKGSPLTGSIFDYMGLPTTFHGSYGLPSVSYKINSDSVFSNFTKYNDSVGTLFSHEGIDSSLSDFIVNGKSDGHYFNSSLNSCVVSNPILEAVLRRYNGAGVSYGSRDSSCFGNTLYYAFPFESTIDISNLTSAVVTFNLPMPQFRRPVSGDNFEFVLGLGDTLHGTYPGERTLLRSFTPSAVDKDISISFDLINDSSYRGPLKGCLYVAFIINTLNSFPEDGYSEVNWSNLPIEQTLTIGITSSSDGVVYDIGSLADNVFSSGAVKINALPFRAYESIYNAFYRDARNNPLIVDGEPEYNKFISSDEGGLDNFDYQLHSRNWENDFLTTSQPTPQFGVAPLVGITSAGTMSFTASEDGKTYNVQAEVGDDGSTISNVSYSENLPASVRRSLVDVVSSGISINDFRNVNAFQRFLETSMRRGLKAFDQIKAHFNVDVDEKILDMPEFIGGVSTVMNSSKVNQTTETDGSPLASYAGQLSLLASQKHKIKCYCDQPGYIIGIICIHPVPLYSQLLPKMFTKFDSLDNFFPEFGNIGMQPVLMQEVSPVQSYSDSADKLKDVFGYQRAWYEYLSNVDEVHGLFRTQLRNFVLNRVFDSAPKLGPDFTVIDDKHLNDIFSVVVDNDDEVNHKFFGKAVFDVKMIRPIPKFGIPRLEPSV